MYTKEPLKPEGPDSVSMRILGNRLMLIVVDGARLAPFLQLYSAVLSAMELDYAQEYKSLLLAAIFSINNRMNGNWDTLEQKFRTELKWLLDLKRKNKNRP